MVILQLPLTMLMFFHKTSRESGLADLGSVISLPFSRTGIDISRILSSPFGEIKIT